MQIRKIRQYFNDIPSSDVPFYMSVSILSLLFFFLVFTRKYMNVMPAALWAAFLLFFLCLTSWFSDVLVESSIRGRYGKKLRSAIVFGFLLFLCSEVMLFGGFFWAFLDRSFTTGVDVFYWMPSGIEATNSLALPLLGTCVLIASGYFVNESYFLLKAREFVWHVYYGYIGITLAICFLCIQAVEYIESGCYMSYGIYGSGFYLLTGFHGLHVIVGLLFLVEQYDRVSVMEVIEYDTICTHDTSVNFFDSDHHLGLTLGIVYWHFVDIIWIFLYFNVYVYNSIEDMEFMLLQSGL